ncbi:hypothetical protein [Arthrobacter woluwensis]|uniref:hypothetical protein n=1 Tax=Arthrobacter woluwensis TaxID=156980 RepID=UPI0027D76C41|nr:hypothetical protein [Arthrobacter woluwensis]
MSDLGTTESSAVPSAPSPAQVLARTELLTAIGARETSAAVRFTEGLLTSRQRVA